MKTVLSEERFVRIAMSFCFAENLCYIYEDGILIGVTTIADGKSYDISKFQLDYIRMAQVYLNGGIHGSYIEIGDVICYKALYPYAVLGCALKTKEE